MPSNCVVHFNDLISSECTRTRSQDDVQQSNPDAQMSIIIRTCFVEEKQILPKLKTSTFKAYNKLKATFSPNI